MSMKINTTLPSPAELKEEIPLSEKLAELKKKRDQEIRDIFTGKSDKFAVITVPGFADNEDSVCEYVDRLAKVNEKVKDKLMIIPRIYTNKPRTTGEGYKGMLHQPDPDKAPDLYAGIIAIRHIHIRAMEESGLTGADEMLYPENRSYLDDILSYEAIGARSVENQQHRLTASGMDIPVGMKNPTSGDLSVMLNSVVAAQMGHRFIYRGMDVQTSGNDLAHVILRGGVDKYGTCQPNYHYEDCLRLFELYQKKDLKNPAAIVDANHSNSNKKYKEQLRIVSEVLHTRRYNPDLKNMIKGVMVESYLEEGRQNILLTPSVTCVIIFNLFSTSYFASTRLVIPCSFGIYPMQTKSSSFIHFTFFHSCVLFPNQYKLSFFFPTTPSSFCFFANSNNAFPCCSIYRETDNSLLSFTVFVRISFRSISGSSVTGFPSAYKIS